MDSLSFPFKYVFWHYTTALVDICYISKNYLWSIYNFYSVKFIFREFFSPIIFTNKTYNNNNALEGMFIKILLILSGIVFRIAELIAYMVTYLFILVVTALIYVIWLLLPVVITSLFISGITLLLV